MMHLRDVPFPADLVPPPGLADTVLHTARRRRRTRTVAIAAAVAVTAALAVPALLLRGPGTPMDPGAPAPAAPGGGPQVAHVYTREEHSSILDPALGKYRELPFTVVLSPDLTRAAVNDNGRLGLADRAALLDRGRDAVEWVDVPAGNGPSWSPDGTAVLWTSIEKDPTVHFTAHRVDVADRHVTNTPVPLDLLGATVGWAADSRRYLVLVRGTQTDNTVEPGPLQYLSPDGTPGARLDGTGGSVEGATCYSPSRRYVLTDASTIMSAQPHASPVYDATSGKVVATVPPRSTPVGWYDETTVAVLGHGADRNAVIELLDITTGTVSRSVRLPGSADVTAVQLGPSAGLTGAAAELSF
ncbi:hypothetical protein GCM10009827_084570 [Dactylosporangium maewongense]|uniref:WD40 repeat protein n=1 Tax=Dactylosporangium maewongense TaxID=634393 RepID=A0ABN2C2N5_9ACTN